MSEANARTRASRSTTWSCSKTRTATASWTSARSSPTSWCCRDRSRCSDHGVLVGEPPNLWLMKDTDGDLKADTKELVSNTYGRGEASIEHNANSLFWALDNTIYTSEHDWHLRLKNGKFETDPDAEPRPVGRDAGRCRADLSATSTTRRCSSTSLPRATSRAIRTWRARAGLYDPLISREASTIWPVRADARREPRLPRSVLPPRRQLRHHPGRRHARHLPRRSAAEGAVW